MADRTLDHRISDGMTFIRKWAGRTLTILALVFVTYATLKALNFNSEAAALSKTSVCRTLSLRLLRRRQSVGLHVKAAD